MSEYYNKDCYFYCRGADGNATIPACRYHKTLYSCPCDKCGAYIPIKIIENLARTISDLNITVYRREKK